MQDHMEDRFTRWQRTAPLAFQCGGARLPLRLMNGWTLGRGSRKNSQADEENGKGQSSVSRLHPKPPHATFRRVDDFRPKRVGMVSSADQALGVINAQKPGQRFCGPPYKKRHAGACLAKPHKSGGLLAD